MKNIFFIAFFILYLSLCHAQDRGELLARLQKSNSQAEKVQILEQLATISKQTNQIDNAISYFKQALDLTDESGSVTVIGSLCQKIADLYLQKQEYETAVEYALQALSLHEKDKNNQKVADLQHYIGSIYKKNQVYEKAIEYFQKSYQYYRQSENIELQKQVLSSLSETYYLNGQLAESEKNYAELVNLAYASNDIKTETEALTKIAVVCTAEKRYEEAIHYTQELSSIYEKNKQINQLAFTQQNLGYLYRQKGDLAQSEAYFQSAIATFEKIKQKDATILSNIAVTYSMLGNFTKSQEYHLQAIEIEKKRNIPEDLADKYNLVAANSLLSQNPFQALQYANQAVQIATPANAYKQLKDSYLILSEVYNRQNDFKAAQDAFKKADEYSKIIENQATKSKENLQKKRIEAQERESDLLLLLSEKEKQSLALRQALLEAEKKEQELTLLKKESELNEANVKNQRLAKERAEQQLRLAEQLLETERQKQQILTLNQEKIMQELALEKQKVAQEEQQKAIELERNRNQIRNLQLKQELQEQKMRERFVYLGGLAALLIMLIMAWAIRRSNRQRKLIQEKNKTLEKQQKQIQEINEELRTSEEEIRQNAEELLVTNEQLESSLRQLSIQNEIIAAKNRDITASITYAKRIQHSILPLPEQMQATFGEYCLLFRPKDIISGDFYWLRMLPDNRILFSVVDCTGHGVPGAFMSLIGSNLLKEIVDEKKIYSPELILNELSKGIKYTLQQEKTANRDGMDLAIVLIDKENRKVEFAGAKNPIVYVQNGELFYLKGDHYEIGGNTTKQDVYYTKQQISLPNDESEKTTFYLFTDGYQDQFGGTEGRGFSIRKFREFLHQIYYLPMQEQERLLAENLAQWQGKTRQIDDICVVGFRV
ncbi:tetratricopeptide repeat protein [Thermoflexibacter ruber]|uniref:Serine phosphatase RsbU, regulator of sigma subunit n=1 Tax=Thermoflexibacter ruber TaxID=1003 RepID=A0A1I2E8B8_9BACT|nr:tetratricopeptide repeat protein [Thermoflexibacter ruber]SFE88879.1 Serine phosphatase RsbU, regulator of sigma subunit [Thermoflexibacter ruber]